MHWRCSAEEETPAMKKNPRNKAAERKPPREGGFCVSVLTYEKSVSELLPDFVHEDEKAGPAF